MNFVLVGHIHNLIWLIRADGQKYVGGGWLYSNIEMIIVMVLLMCRLDDGLLLHSYLATRR